VNRRRTAVIALAVCAVGALSGCSAASEHPGAAAIVGDQRIAVATLQADVSAYRAALSQDAGAQEGSSVPGQTLQLLVLAQVVQQTLDERGLSVSEGQVQQDEAADATQAGGAAALAQDFVQQLSLAPSSMDTYYRMRAGELELLQQAGVDPTATDAGTQLQKILAASADRLGVQVNPRYGVWNDQKLALAAPSAPWLKA
jgi:SurA N-terminal domain